MATEQKQQSVEVTGWAARKLREHTVPKQNPENFPWRRWRTPYRIFLAEFLLVRTRTDMVAREFENIATRYPDLPSLVSASDEELLSDLAPLGMRKRVPLLLRAAKYLMEQHEGYIPEEVEELEAVPGLGPYTAAAIATFAFDSKIVPADVNILRFLSRLTGLPMTHPTKGSKELRELLPLLSPAEGGPNFEVLLDFSRLTCRPGKPKCFECPVRNHCCYFAAAQSQEFVP